MIAKFIIMRVLLNFLLPETRQVLKVCPMKEDPFSWISYCDRFYFARIPLLHYKAKQETMSKYVGKPAIS